MKKIYLLGSAIIILLSLINCSRDYPSVEQEHINADLARAIKCAEQMYSIIYGSNTRSDKRSMTSYEVYFSESTRSISETEKIFFLNYGNNDGFAMVCVNDNSTLLCAISDEGTLSLNDTITNTSFKYYFNCLTASRIIPIPDPEPEPYFPDPQDPQLPTTKIVYSTPLISKNVSNVSQSYPYNRACPMISGLNCVVGCAPLAAGIVMSFFEYPTSYNNINFNWTEIKNDMSDIRWSNIFEICGRDYNLDATYGLSSTPAYPLYLPRTFTNLGYKNTKYEKFAIDKVNTSLKKSSPIIVSGWVYDTETHKDSNIGHTWVIDGGYSVTLHYNNPNFSDSESFYYHNIWGWSGKNNGYFIFQQNNLSGNPYSYDNENNFKMDVYKYMTIAYDFTPDK